MNVAQSVSFLTKMATHQVPNSLVYWSIDHSKKWSESIYGMMGTITTGSPLEGVYSKPCPPLTPSL